MQRVNRRGASRRDNTFQRARAKRLRRMVRERRRGHLLGKLGIAPLAEEAERLLSLAHGIFTCASDLLAEHFGWVSRVFHWNGDPNRLRRRREPYRKLALERLEFRRMLSDMMLFSPGQVSPPNYTWANSNVIPNLENWHDETTGQYSTWGQGDTAVFDASNGSLTVNVSGNVQVEGITFEGSYATAIDAVLGSGAAISAYAGNNNIALTGN